MGKAILYCFKCSSLLREDDFANGKAVRSGDYAACAGCAPALPPAPPENPPKRHITSTRLPAPRPGSSPAVKRPAAPEPAPPNRKLLLITGSAAAVLVLIVILVVAFSGGKAAEPPAPPVAGADVAAPKPPAETPDRKALESARQWAKAHPQDLSGQIREYQSVVLEWERSPSAPEAQKEIVRLKAEIRGLVDAALPALEREIKDFMDRRDYASALKIVEAAASRLPYPDWELARSKREYEIRDLLGKAPAAAPVEEKKAPPPPEPKAASGELKTWTPKWSQAMARATARDHAAAAAELLRSAASLKDEGLRVEAAQDIADLKAIQGFLAASMEWLLKRPPGSSLALQLRDGRSVGGRILQIGPERVELRGEKESIFAEWSDVAAASFGALPRKDPPAPRLLAAFCLLEGEIDAAKSIVGGATAAVGDRFWSYAEGAKALIPKPEPAELSARELFYAAEREYRSMASRGPAAEKYSKLKGEFAATVIVRRSLDRIQKRSEAGREYFLPASGFFYGGTFRLLKDGRLESKSDSEASATLQNFAETDFYALPSTPYRCWILAGGCCLETFGFLWQGTELRDTDPKTKQKIALEPGTSHAASVKLSLKGLKATHSEKEPKSAARWEWIEIPLPRYAAPGLKKVHLLTSQQGFSIAAALVSSTRPKPPTEAELKELEKAAAAEQPPRPVDPDLIGHWTFDEGAGDEAQDASGNGHTGKLIGGAAWAPGQGGGGIRCDGNGAHVQLPNSPLLDKVQTGSFTLSAWYKPEVVPPGPADANDSAHAILIKRGWHEGLVYNREARFIVEHWIVGENKATCGTWGDTWAVGKFYHVAGVVDRAAGRTRVYVDGRLKGTNDWAPGTETRDFKSEIWRIGIGAPGAPQWAYPAKGVIDDVRIYQRALSADEIQGLYELTR